MKVVHILGRGVEGCGVTRFTLEMQDWALAKGWDYSIYASKDKKWTRAKSHVLGPHVHQQKFGDKPARGDLLHGVDNIIKEANSADLVIFGSLPSKGHPEDCKANFKKLLDSITSKVIMIQHDHKMMSIKRNACLNDAILRADVIFSYSSRSPFMNYCREIGAKGALTTFCNAINFTEIKERYWKPIEEQDPDHFKWIGRSAYWKGFDVFFDLYKNENHENKESLLYTLEGMEKSIQFVNIREMFDFNEMAEDYSVIDNLPRGDKPYIFGAFNHADMLERMSKSGFGFQLTYLQPEYIQNFVEFTHLEIVAVGAIPVFRKEYGNNCTHLKTGNKLTADKNSGTLWIGEVGSDHSEIVTKMNALRKDPVMRDEYRHMAYEYYTAHNSPNSSFNDFYDKAQTKEKSKGSGISAFFA